MAEETKKTPQTPEEIAREAMRLAMHKLPIKCRFATKAQLEEEVEG